MKLASIAAAAALLLPVAAMADPVVSVTPASQSATAGGTVTVTVALSGLQGVTLGGVQQILSTFYMDLTFDSSLLSFKSAAFIANDKFSTVAGDTCDVLQQDCVFSASATLGDVTASVFSWEVLDAPLQTLQAGWDGSDLFSLTFDVNPGDGNVATNIGFANFPGVSPILNGLTPAGGDTSVLNVSYNGACIDIGGTGACNANGGPGVPEPASYGLVMLALLGAGYASRRRA